MNVKRTSKIFWLSLLISALILTTVGDSTVLLANDSATHVVKVACGSSYTVALKNDGTVWAWGYNGSDQLGDGTNADKPIGTG